MAHPGSIAKIFNPCTGYIRYPLKKKPTENDYPSVLARKHEARLQAESIALFSNAVHVW
jgi:hypothetical protein